MCVVSRRTLRRNPLGVKDRKLTLTFSSLKTVATSLLWPPKAGRIAPPTGAIRSTPVWGCQLGRKMIISTPPTHLSTESTPPPPKDMIMRLELRPKRAYDKPGATS